VSGPSAWIDGLARGDRAALARAITAVENDTPAAAAVLAAVRGRLGRALVIGITGAPGAGKSTLTAAMIEVLRAGGKSVGVVAVDPSSPITGGAILGDRIRMSRHAGDDGVFVRSLAARGHLGGLSRTAERVIDVMDAAGREVVIVETVGTGQNEVEIAGIADVRVVVVAPGLGDDVQAIKAGILEIADLLVVNKADHPLADRTARQLAIGTELGERAVPVLKTVASSGEGVAALVEAVVDLRRALGCRRLDPAHRRAALAGAAGDFLAEQITGGGEAIDALAAALAEGRIGRRDAAREALALLAGKGKPE